MITPPCPRSALPRPEGFLAVGPLPRRPSGLEQPHTVAVNGLNGVVPRAGHGVPGRAGPREARDRVRGEMPSLGLLVALAQTRAAMATVLPQTA